MVECIDLLFVVLNYKLRLERLSPHLDHAGFHCALLGSACVSFVHLDLGSFCSQSRGPCPSQNRSQDNGGGSLQRERFIKVGT